MVTTCLFLVDDSVKSSLRQVTILLPSSRCPEISYTVQSIGRFDAQLHLAVSLEVIHTVLVASAEICRNCINFCQIYLGFVPRNVTDNCFSLNRYR